MNVYALLSPLAILLLLLEIVYCVKKKNGYYSFQDTVANLATGIGNQCINLAVLFFVYHFYGWLYNNVAPWKIPATWYSLLILLLLQDFIFYWFHRVGHTINIFWAAHMPHHSSEEMNLSVGLRASFTQRMFQFLFFDWILAVIGYSPEMIYSMAAVHLFLAYWHHTRLIKKMGILEKIFVTPSHHRVHHGVNTQYLDKNFSEFLIIWDKIFGSFEEEKEEVCYGVTHPPRTWDPIYINIQYWKQLWDDAVAADSWWDKIRIWFMPLGWRPKNVGQAFPRVGYTRESQVKFSSKQFRNTKPYIIAQIAAGLVYMFITINLTMPLTITERLIMTAGIFMMTIGWGGILRAKKWAVALEMFRLLYMLVTLIAILNAHGMAEWIGWQMIAGLIFVGASVLWMGFFFKSHALEGEAIPVHPELHVSA
ncbi:sterol desaturase family protein [Lacibacter sediminis]|uniref:Sterol desaturase family protein n=1 Tax=Lacibacter sediminis TaxID=2760713 RepID=A0A7G5XHG6_9BACT|nr:sterol desaturase family protein [Lacibacter sediminis]QNA44919.1 sterol desaturase family protein [Lacibacter sediminis]